PSFAPRPGDSASRSNRRRSTARASNSTSPATPSATRLQLSKGLAVRRSKPSWRRATGHSRTSEISLVGSIRAPSTSGCWEASPPTGASTIVLPAPRPPQEAPESAQRELFGAPAAPEPIKIPDVQGWLPAERLQREYDAVGFFLTGHPPDDHAG